MRKGGTGMTKRRADRPATDNHRQSPPRPRPATAPPPPRHSTPQAVTGSHSTPQAVTPLHSTLEVAPENPPDATHFLKENANGLASKLRGPSLPPASTPR